MDERPGWEDVAEDAGAEGLLRATGRAALAVGAVLLAGVLLIFKALGAAMRVAHFCTRW